MSDNPAYDTIPTAANHHYTMWNPIFVGGLVGSSNSAFRSVMEEEGIASRPESEAVLLAAAAADTDGDGDIDPAASGATAGTPGSFTGTGAAIPQNLDALNSVMPLPNPSTDWTTGQRVVLGDGDTAHWLADTLPATTGEADTELFTSTAHGLAVNDAVIFTAATGGTGLSTDTMYRVATVPDANSFTLKTNAGVAVTFTTDLTAATTITGQYYDGNAA